MNPMDAKLELLISAADMWDHVIYSKSEANKHLKTNKQRLVIAAERSRAVRRQQRHKQLD